MRTRLLMIIATVCLLAPGVSFAGGGSSEGGLGLVAAIGLAIIAATVVMVLFNLLRLPALLGYIVAGLLLGAFAAPVLGHSIETMEHISHLGLVFLLFIIGLEMDLRGILRLGPRTALAVLLQAPIAIAVVLGVQYGADALGFSIPGLGSSKESFFFFAVACALGSTAVVVKLLGDKFDLDSKAGKITILTLIAEDIWAVFALSYVTSTMGDQSTNLFVLIGGGIGVAIALVVFSRFVLGRVFATLAKSPDLMALLAIGWCFLCAQSMSMVGLSAEMGALIAGLTVGALPVHVDVLAKVSSLRDFFMALFFVTLGMTLPFPTLEIFLHALALVAIVILVRMLLYTPTLFGSKLGPIVSFAVPINLSQVSEFTLLLIPLGLASGGLSMEQGSVISYGLMLSVVVSTFTIGRNYQLAIWLSKVLPVKKTEEGEESKETRQQEAHAHHDIVMLGFFLNAEALAAELKQSYPELISRILVIDFNLQNHPRIRKHGFHVTYGDISNFESLEHHGIANAKVVISTISNTFLRGTRNEDLAYQVKKVNPQARFIATADDTKNASSLFSRGIFRVVVPPVHAASVFAQALHDALEES